MEYLSLDMQIALYCVFAQVALTFYAVFRMGVARLRAVAQKEVRLGEIALSSEPYPEEAKKHANNLSNQFEMPTLMYVAVILAAIFDASSMPFALALIVFTVSRYLHRLIHVTGNDVRQRFSAFLVGVVALFVAWLFLGLGFLGIIS